MALLLVERGKDRGRALPVEAGKPVTVGREARCELPIRDVMVSRRHFQVRHESGGFVVRDLRSSNGTFLNGKRCSPDIDYPFDLEDKVEVGSTLVSLVPDEAAGSEGRGELTGRTIAGYAVMERLGRGGMGTVYKALQLSLDRTVALKVLARDLAGERRRVEMFLSEARAAGKLNHPNIVQVYDVGESDGRFFFSMEFMERGSLEEVVEKEGRLLVPRALRVAIDAARGLEYAERQRIVHRDVKPGNIMVNGEGVAKIGDLGIARAASAQADTGTAAAVSGDSRLANTVADTAGGGETVAGSPLYMSPEQARGGPVDHRADLYSLGATLFHVLSGEPPFTGSSPREVIQKHVNEAARGLGEVDPAIPADVAALVARLLEKRPEDRPASASALLEELRLLAARYPESWRPGDPPIEGVAPASDAAPAVPALERARELAARVRALPRPALAAIALGLLLVAGLAVRGALRSRETARLERDRIAAEERDRVERERVAAAELEKRRAERKREQEAAAALADAVQFSIEHDDLASARERYLAVASKFPGTPAAASATASVEQLTSDLAQVADVKKKKADAEAAAEAALRPLVDSIVVAPPLELDRLQAKLVEAAKRHADADATKKLLQDGRAAHNRRVKALAKTLDAEVAAALAKQDYAGARAAIEDASKLGVGDLKVAIGDKRRLVAQQEGDAKAAADAARDRAHVEEVAAIAAADDATKRAAFLFLDVERALEALKKRGLAFDDTRARLDRRIFGVGAEEQLKQKLLLHVEKGGEPALRFPIATGLEGVAIAADADGVTFQAKQGGAVIEQRKLFAALKADELARLFGGLPNLSPTDRFGLGLVLLDHGDAERARRELDRAVRDDASLRDKLPEKE